MFETPLGKIGLMIGTDRCWPEIPLVMALEGAELILVSSGVEPVPQAFPHEIITRVRALDDHVTIVSSNYSGELPYLCSNHPTYTGEPLGRGFVVDRNGIILADTGIRPGVAVAQVDLAQRKNIYHLTFKEDRKLFHYLTDLDLKPTVVKGSKRKIRVSIATVGFAHGPNPRPDSEFAKILDEAGSHRPDVILMTEVRHEDRRRLWKEDTRPRRRESEEVPDLHHHRRPDVIRRFLIAAAAERRGRISGIAPEK